MSAHAHVCSLRLVSCVADVRVRVYTRAGQITMKFLMRSDTELEKLRAKTEQDKRAFESLLRSELEKQRKSMDFSLRLEFQDQKAELEVQLRLLPSLVPRIYSVFCKMSWSHACFCEFEHVSDLWVLTERN